MHNHSITQVLGVQLFTRMVVNIAGTQMSIVCLAQWVDLTTLSQHKGIKLSFLLALYFRTAGSRVLILFEKFGLVDNFSQAPRVAFSIHSCSRTKPFNSQKHTGGVCTRLRLKCSVHFCSKIERVGPSFTRV